MCTRPTIIHCALHKIISIGLVPVVHLQQNDDDWRLLWSGVLLFYLPLHTRVIPPPPPSSWLGHPRFYPSMKNRRIARGAVAASASIMNEIITLVTLFIFLGGISYLFSGYCDSYDHLRGIYYLVSCPLTVVPANYWWVGVGPARWQVTDKALKRTFTCAVLPDLINFAASVVVCSLARSIPVCHALHMPMIMEQMHEHYYYIIRSQQ